MFYIRLEKFLHIKAFPRAHSALLATLSTAGLMASYTTVCIGKGDSLVMLL